MATTRSRKPGQRSAGHFGDEFVFAHWTELPHFDATAPRRSPWDTVGWLERILALLGLIAIAPVLCGVALAIKLESPGGSVFFRQTRVGLNRRRRTTTKTEARKWSGKRNRRKTRADGQVFHIWKFRTMIPDAEAKTGPVWATEDDPRITRVGHLLRKTRLDEVPQLINVAAGHMHLIGPRPERPELIAELVHNVPDYCARLAIRPGITGLAQVERAYDENVDYVKRKVMYDTFYIKNRCWLLDLKILAKTVDVVLRGWGAR